MSARGVALALALAGVVAAPAPARGQGAPDAAVEAADAGAGGAVDPGAGSAGSAGGAGSGGAGSADPGAGAVIQLPVDELAPEVSASASPTVVRLGGRFTLFITAAFAEGVEVNLPEPLDLGPGFEITRRVSEDRPRADGKRVREWQLDVTAWDLGEVRLAPIAVTFTVAGRAGQVPTNGLKLRVEGVLGDVADEASALRGLQPPRELVARDLRLVWLALGVAGALALVAGAVMWRRRRRRRTARLLGGVVAAPARLDMTGERALAALLALDEAGTLARDEARRGGYVQMVAIVRAYLAGRYAVPGGDLTSSELVGRLRAAATAEEAALVEGWLARCDLVKYGGVAGSAAEAKAVLDDARALIVTTTALRTAPRAAEAA